MTPEDFAALVDEHVEDLRASLREKAKEYAKEGDRLWNFKRAAALKRETPERALWGFFVKHIISVADMIDDIDRGVKTPAGLWEEKLRDVRNYAVLLHGLVR
jgi:hypothetical protein